MSAVADRLNLRVKRELKPIQDADFATLNSEAGAVRYACERSGLQDKSIAIDIGTDPALLSKAKTGQARLSEDSMDALMDTTGCEAPLIAWILRRGYDPRSLRKLESETETALREAYEALDAERNKVRVLTAALRGETT